MARLAPILAVLTVTATACGSAAGGMPPRAGHAAAGCAVPAGAKVLARDTAAVVYSKAGTVSGCSARTGRRTALGTARSCIAASLVGPVVLAGGTAAYGVESCGVDTGSASVVVRRLADGKVMHDTAAITGPLGPESFSHVDSVVVRTTGAVAWIAQGNSIIHAAAPRIEVHLEIAGPSRLLDSGGTIATKSLRLRHGRLTWRNGSALRAASL